MSTAVGNVPGAPDADPAGHLREADPSGEGAEPGDPQLSALQELSLEAIEAMRRILDLAEVLVADPEVLAELARAGRSLVAPALPPDAGRRLVAQVSATVEGLVPAQVRADLLVALATMVAPTAPRGPSDAAAASPPSGSTEPA